MGCFKTVTKEKSITRNLNGEMKIFYLSTCAGKLIHREKHMVIRKKPAMLCRGLQVSVETIWR